MGAAESHPKIGAEIPTPICGFSHPGSRAEQCQLCAATPAKRGDSERNEIIPSRLFYKNPFTLFATPGANCHTHPQTDQDSCDQIDLTRHAQPADALGLPWRVSLLRNKLNTQLRVPRSLQEIASRKVSAAASHIRLAALSWTSRRTSLGGRVTTCR